MNVYEIIWLTLIGIQFLGGLYNMSKGNEPMKQPKNKTHGSHGFMLIVASVSASVLFAGVTGVI